MLRKNYIDNIKLSPSLIPEHGHLQSRFQLGGGGGTLNLCPG